MLPAVGFHRLAIGHSDVYPSGPPMSMTPPSPSRRLSQHSPATYVRAAAFQTLWGLVKYIPSPIGDVLRRVVLGAFAADCRVPATWIRTGVDVWWPENIRIGRSCINENVFLNAYGGITIGDHCLIGRGASLFAGGHTFDRIDQLIIEQPLVRAPIHVGDDVYFGLNCSVLGGVTIGHGAVIGAGAVVTRDVPPLAVVSGVPARVTRYRNESSSSQNHHAEG